MLQRTHSMRGTVLYDGKSSSNTRSTSNKHSFSQRPESIVHKGVRISWQLMWEFQLMAPTHGTNATMTFEIQLCVLLHPCGLLVCVCRMLGCPSNAPHTWLSNTRNAAIALCWAKGAAPLPDGKAQPKRAHHVHQQLTVDETHQRWSFFGTKQKRPWWM